MWMSKNKLSHDPDISFELRRVCVEECEALINCKYEIIKELDKFFEIKNG